MFSVVSLCLISMAEKVTLNAKMCFGLGCYGRTRQTEYFLSNSPSIPNPASLGLSESLLLLLLLLRHFSHIRLFVTPETAAHQASPSLRFSRQEHWRGCHFLLQCVKVKSESEVAQSCLTCSDSMDCSLPGSSIHGIF